ncbi:hypothetical protein RJ641_004677 [Dillenia turbinata]|uniref:DRBM domain-containing protein n=1 Tax=Dillenia turbinata TaxID=194707 RepID=A0AAN8VMV5_9MAGN
MAEDSMAEVCPMEDTVQVLIEYLVAPMLPSKSSMRNAPSPSQQLSVAKQVHAVVLLYNYYHRKEHPLLEFLNFESFCKLAVVIKPSLMLYMKLMQASLDTELDHVDKQLSVTEKMIMEACDICTGLDASKDAPCIDGWKTSKVTVFLIDSRKENCFLLFSSITQGVWSVIEKALDIANGSSQGVIEPKLVYKKKKGTKKAVKEEGNNEEFGFRQIAFSVVKEMTGISQADLVVLENHVVYSFTKEKTTARFYIMQCTKSIGEDVIQFPIRDVIESVQGPLVKRISKSWVITPVVEYFHVLPYSNILFSWLARGLDPMSALGTASLSGSESTQKLESNMDIDGPISSGVADIRLDHGTLKQKCSGGFVNHLTDNSCATCKKDEENYSTEIAQTDEKLHSPDTVQVDHNEMPWLLGSDLNPSSSGDNTNMKAIDSMTNPCINGAKAEGVVIGNDNCHNITSDHDETAIGDRALVTYQPNCGHLYKVQLTIASKDKALSETALRVLQNKRDKLCRQQREIEDEIAWCDRRILAISSGSTDDLAMKLETIIEGCNELCVRNATKTQDRISQNSEDHGSLIHMKRKRITEAVPNLRTPCQDLDDVCCANNWILPVYRVTPADVAGGFKAEVTVTGRDFEVTVAGESRATPPESRESAASNMLTKLPRTSRNELVQPISMNHCQEMKAVNSIGFFDRSDKIVGRNLKKFVLISVIISSIAPSDPFCISPFVLSKIWGGKAKYLRRETPVINCGMVEELILV